jgi:hypothetical protein
MVASKVAQMGCMKVDLMVGLKAERKVVMKGSGKADPKVDLMVEL